MNQANYSKLRVILHQTHHTIGDFAEIFAALKKIVTTELESAQGPTVHVFPELCLTGYPLQDLVLQPNFYLGYLAQRQEFWEWAQKQQAPHPALFLLSGPDYQFENGSPQLGLIEKISNSLFALEFKGQGPNSKPIWSNVYSKRLLPNYDIFDEQKYFTPGQHTGVYQFGDKKIGLLICEDMWSSKFYQCNPVLQLAKLSAAEAPDLVVNLSASPFHIGKQEQRVARAGEIAQLLGVPFYYCNRVGGEDEILFDGQSFAFFPDAQGGRVENVAPLFTPARLEFSLGNKISPTLNLASEQQSPNTWESLFNPRLELTKSENGPKFKTKSLSLEDARECFQALQFGLQEYARKTGHQKFLVAVSGGIDSGLVAAIVRQGLRPGQTLETIFMPSQFTSTQSYDLASALCKNLQVKMYSFPIKFLHSAVRNAFKDCFNKELQGLADENIQSRLRGTLLYTKANEGNFLVINTSNKSELAVGYSTLYGDSVGALSLLGDIYKEEVFQLSHYFNQIYGEKIPVDMIKRPPTAELRANQVDTDSLPPYERLDAILESFLSYRVPLNHLLEQGFSREEVERSYRLYLNSEYKRSQFCPIIKVKPKSFGFGHRNPICKKMPNLT